MDCRQIVVQHMAHVLLQTSELFVSWINGRPFMLSDQCALIFSLRENTRMTSCKLHANIPLLMPLRLRLLQLW